VNLSFLSHMLRRCGFGEKWCNFIAHCIFKVRFSILVNDNLTGFIVPVS
jgi:hypothetical protein